LDADAVCTFRAAVRNSCKSSSYAPLSTKAGQVWMILDHIVGSATATFAAEEATEPRITRGHGSRPPLRSRRASPSRVMEAPSIMPSTESGRRAARHSGSPWHRASSYMWE